MTREEKLDVMSDIIMDETAILLEHQLTANDSYHLAAAILRAIEREEQHNEKH